jgi:hypothetical protein
MSGLGATLLSIMMIAVFALLAGGAYVAVKRDRKRGLLMLAAGLVMLTNVLIWTL